MGRWAASCTGCGPLAAAADRGLWVVAMGGSRLRARAAGRGTDKQKPVLHNRWAGGAQT